MSEDQKLRAVVKAMNKIMTEVSHIVYYTSPRRRLSWLETKDMSHGNEFTNK